jgi:hypothetical protein
VLLPLSNLRLRAISITTGNIIAATACSGMKRESRELESNIPKMRNWGLLSNRVRKKREILFDNPVCIIAPAIMNTPSRKKTALFPKKEKTRRLSSISRAGRRMMAARLVTANGMGVKIQRVMQMVATPKHFIPAALRPEGGGNRIRVRPIIKPIRRSSWFNHLRRPREGEFLVEAFIRAFR